MSSRVIDDEFDEPNADELWEYNENLLDEPIPDEDDIPACDEDGPDSDENLQTGADRQAPTPKRRGSAGDKRPNGADEDSPPSWRIIEMRREQRDLDDFLKEVYDD